MSVVVVAILALALAGILLRPWDVHEAVFALAGAVAMVVVGGESVRQAADVIWDERGVLAFLAGVLALAALADAVGLFDVAAQGALRRSGGSTRRLFWLLAIVSAVGTALLSLDAVAVALTPVVLVAAARARLDAEPFLFASIAVANAASVALPVSNPTNILVADHLGIGFVDYARTMLPVAVAAALAVTVVLALRFRRPLAGSFRMPPPRAVSVERRPLVLACVLLVATLAGFVVFPHDLGAVALVAGIVGVAGLLIGGRLGPRDAALSFGPRLLVFAAGIFVMVDALQRHGLRDLLAEHAPDSPIGVGLAGAGLANIVNNLPATALALPMATDPDRAYALLAGVDIGPNLTLTGSLATLLWLALARERDVEVSPVRYLAIGVLTAPVGLAAALLTLEVLR